MDAGSLAGDRTAVSRGTRAPGAGARRVSGAGLRGDPALRHEVELLLAQAASADGFLEAGPWPPRGALVGRAVLTGRRLGVYEVQAQHRRRRHGRGLSRARHEARTRRRDQDAAARVHGGSRPAGALRARGARARLAQSSEHRDDLRPRGAATAVRALVLELVEGETLAERIARGRASPSDRRGAGDRAADRRRARGGAREGHRPPRSEARQHQDHARRRGEGARLRAGEGVRRRRGPIDAVADGDDRRHRARA